MSLLVFCKCSICQLMGSCPKFMPLYILTHASMGSFIKCCCLSLSVIVFLNLSVFLVGSIHSGPGRLSVFFSYLVTLKVLQLLILIVRQAKGLTVILTHYSFIEWVLAEVTPICVQHGQSCLLTKMAAACQGRVKDKKNSAGLFVKHKSDT